MTIDRGADVVVASVATHGRPGTARVLAGLEIVPPAAVTIGDTLTERLDLDAVLARKPQVAILAFYSPAFGPGSSTRAASRASHSAERPGISRCRASVPRRKGRAKVIPDGGAAGVWLAGASSDQQPLLSDYLSVPAAGASAGAGGL